MDWKDRLKQEHYELEEDSEIKTLHDGTIIFMRKGLKHRMDGPAVISPNGAIEYWQGGMPHRKDGPAIIYPDGTEHWLNHGTKHRIGGPASTFPNWSKEWYRYGMRHREDGPAIEWLKSGNKQFWVNGKKYTEEEFKKLWTI